MSYLSEPNHTNSFLDFFPSKRATLRKVNRAYHEQLQQVDACLRGAAQKYGEENLMRTCESSHFGKDYEGTLAGQAYLDGRIYLEESEDNIVCNSPCYESAISQQQQLFSELQDIKKILKIKSAPLNLEKAAQYSPINWEILIRQQRPLHRELIRTNIDKCSADSAAKSRDYIAYTEQSSSQLIPQIEQRRYGQPSPIIRREAQLNPREDALRSIEARVIHSPCTMEGGQMCKQTTKCLQLLNRLNKEKRERDQLLKGISFNLAKS